MLFTLVSSNTFDYIYPIIIPYDFDVEDAFFSTNTPDYTPASPDYSLASPGNTSPDHSDDLSKYLLASLAISPFHDDPYMKVMQAYNATSNELPIPLPQAPIAPPTVLPPSLDSYKDVDGDLPSRYQVYQGRLLVSFKDDAKYEHVGQDTRSQGGKDDQDKQGKDLKISDVKTKSKDKDKGSR
ncbi:hypothetical protein Tco_0407752 [Tanacetum coccineum]